MIFGLRNMGNTCFMNSVLQSLLSLEPLKNELLNDQVESGLKPVEYKQICESIINIFKMIKKNDVCKTLIPVSLYNSLCNLYKNDFFRNKRQQDAHECYLIFIDILEQVLGKKLDIFYGSIKINLSCMNCNNNIVINEIFSSTRVPHGFKDEIIENYKCDKCIKTTLVKKTFEIEKFPEILCVYINRFSNNGNKITDPFCFKENLYNKYDLYSIILHSGYSINCGHYYNVSKRDGEWVCFNDSSVSAFDINSIDQREIYMLFYVKNNS